MCDRAHNTKWNLIKFTRCRFLLPCEYDFNANICLLSLQGRRSGMKLDSDGSGNLQSSFRAQEKLGLFD